MDKEEKEKKAVEIAHEVTEKIVSNCEPDEMGMVISIIMKSLHNMFETRIAGSETNLETDRGSYTLFLNNCEFPAINEAKKG